MKRATCLAFCLLAFGCSTSQKSSVGTNGIDEALLDRKNDFHACYLNELTKSSTKTGGEVVIDFVIGADGTASAAAVTSTTLNQPKVEDCILRTVRTIHFPAPKPGHTTQVTYPFKFSPN